MLAEALRYTCRCVMESALCCPTMNDTLWSLLAALWFPLPEHPFAPIMHLHLFSYPTGVKGLEIGHKQPYSLCYNYHISPLPFYLEILCWFHSLVR